MNSLERVSKALNHEEPDKIPFDIGGTMVTGINVKALRSLRKYLGLAEDVEVRDKITQMAETGDDIIERLKIDVKNVSPQAPCKQGLVRDLGLQGEHYRLIDEFGMGWEMPKVGGHYYDLYKSPALHRTSHNPSIKTRLLSQSQRALFFIYRLI